MSGAATFRRPIDPEDEGTLIAWNVHSYHKRDLAGREGKEDKCSSNIFLPKNSFFFFLVTELKRGKKELGEGGESGVCILRSGSNPQFLESFVNDSS